MHVNFTFTNMFPIMNHMNCQQMSEQDSENQNDLFKVTLK